MLEQGTLAHPAATIQHNELAWAWMAARQHAAQKRKFSGTIEKHGAWLLTKGHAPCSGARLPKAYHRRVPGFEWRK